MIVPTGEYLPRVQSIGAVEVLEHLWPAGQDTQAVAPAKEYSVAAQASGAAVASAQDEPAGHFVQDVSVFPVAYHPVGQIEQTAKPPPEYFPGPQSAGVAEGVAHDFPTGHGVHAVLTPEVV